MGTWRRIKAAVRKIPVYPRTASFAKSFAGDTRRRQGIWQIIARAGIRKKHKVSEPSLIIPAVYQGTGEPGSMRVLIISDTHGNHKNLDQVLESERPYERIIHLGDIEGAEDYIEAAAGCPVDAVRGNNDYFSELPAEQILEVAGKRILITHGHYYYVDAGVEHLVKEARGRDADIVMFGHTHRPLIRQEEDGIVVLNPGSLSFPRQEGRRPTYIVMEIAEQDKVQNREQSKRQNELKIFLKNL